MTFVIAATEDRKTRARPGQKNTFGMMPGHNDVGGSCPGCTLGEGGCQFIPKRRKTPLCYVERLLAGRKNVKHVLEHNTEYLCSADADEVFSAIDAEFNRFEHEEAKKGNQSLNYRIHWAGDVPDKVYAEALKRAIMAHTDTFFWGYTRSFFTVPMMAGIENLNWYLSLDDVNFDVGWAVYEKYKHHDNILVSYMGKEKRTLPDGARMVPCPVDNGKMELEEACCRCKLCWGKKHVWFKTR